MCKSSFELFNGGTIDFERLRQDSIKDASVEYIGRNQHSSSADAAKSEDGQCKSIGILLALVVNKSLGKHKHVTGPDI